MISVVLADDQEMVRIGLRAIVDAEPDLEVVGVASDGRELLQMARTLSPDVCAIDIRMPHVSGIEATIALNAMPDPPAVVIVTTFDEDDLLHEALKAGATGFVLKDAPGPVLVDAIRRAAAGESVMSSGPTKRLIAGYMSADRRQIIDLDLSDREVDVLLALCDGQSNREIGEKLHISVSTVKGHVTRLLEKTRCTNRVGLVIWAMRHTDIEL